MHCHYLHSLYIQCSLSRSLSENKSEIQESALEDGMSLHHQARGRSRVRKHSAERPRVKDQVLVMDSPLKSLIQGDAAVWILAGLQHSSPVPNIQICATVHMHVRAFICMWRTFCPGVYCLHLPAHACILYCIFLCDHTCECMCVFDSVCVYSVIAGGYKKVGLSVWENARRRPKITNALNNPDWPRHKAWAWANICYSACL